MRVVILRVPGVERVDVSLERALVDVRLRPGNTLTLAELRAMIKSGGFTGKEADVTVDGTLAMRDGTLVLDVTGTKSTLTLEDAKDLAGRPTGSAVQITGRVEAGKDTLKVKTVR